MKSKQNKLETEQTNAMPIDNQTEYIDEFGNPIDPSLIDEFGNYIGGTTEYVDEFGNPIDPSLIDEFGNYIGESNNTLNLETDTSAIADSLTEASTPVESASARQMDDKEMMQGMVTFDYNNVPITDIVNSIILDAINKGASDIHFDPFDDGIKIRIRIDGQLNDYSIVPLFVKKNMITRVKIISGMNITESRIPQDGAIRTELADKTIDLRVSCLPTNMGEKIVIRIMDYSMSAAGVEALDFNEKNLEKVKKMLELPNGIILVTGATGSGKSTTVYSMLQRLNKEGTNLITVEDPIEMNIGGINQVQAVSEIGLTFATVLRSILRQDPDVIMIGEIRDDETARIAVRASITGHLVLSTIHTNNSLNTIERLTDMSVERYLLGTALSGIVSQKLARRLCEKCKKLRKTNDYEKEILKKVLNKDVEEIYEPVGCPHCSKGYRGRIAIQEVLLLNQTIQDAITKGVDKSILRKLVYGENGTETMLADGLEKVLEGKTSFDEIIKLIDLEDDLGTGTQLGLTNQIEAAQMNTSPINLGNNPININITPELLKGLSGLNNLIENNDNQINTNIITNKPTTEETKEEIKRLEDGPAIELNTPVVQEEQPDKLENLDEQKEENVIDILDEPAETLEQKDSSIDILDEPSDIEEIKDDNTIEILDEPESVQELTETNSIDILDEQSDIKEIKDDNAIEIFDEPEKDNQKPTQVIENSQVEIFDKPVEENIQEENKTNIEIQEDNQPSLDELIEAFKNNLNQINKKKFILNTKKLANELGKYDLHNDLIINIVKTYINTIKNTNKLRINDKQDLISILNRTFGINESIDEIDELTEESLESIEELEGIASNNGITEAEINSILNLNNQEIEVYIDNNKEKDDKGLEITLDDETDTQDNNAASQPDIEIYRDSDINKDNHTIEVSLDDESESSQNNDIEVYIDNDNSATHTIEVSLDDEPKLDMLDDSIENIKEPIKNKLSKIALDDKDLEFSAIDDSVINSILDNFDTIKEDN